MTKITKKAVLHALSHVEDPDLKKDLVTLNMIRNIETGPDSVRFTLMLTTPACPLKELLKSRCTEALNKHIGGGLNIQIDLDSQVTSARNENEKVMSGIRNIIGIASGKGGVGKSTVAVNMAVGLARMGAKTGILDADIHGPSLPVMLGIDEQPGSRDEGEKTILIPASRYDVKVMSMGMLIGENQPLVWRGPMLASALKQMMLDVDWGDLDYLIIDLPPGTGDIHLSLAQQFPINAVNIVTTPQKVAQSDVIKTIEMFRSHHINVPLLGIVENMSWFTPAEYPDHKYYLFGRDGGRELADRYELPLLAQIPLVMGLGEDADAGRPAVLSDQEILRRPFMDMAGKAAQEMAKLNAEILKAV